MYEYYWLPITLIEKAVNVFQQLQKHFPISDSNFEFVVSELDIHVNIRVFFCVFQIGGFRADGSVNTGCIFKHVYENHGKEIFYIPVSENGTLDTSLFPEIQEYLHNQGQLP